MKTLTQAIVIASVGLVLPLSAQVTQTREKTETKENPDGSVTEKHTTTTKTFDATVQKRVVQYFDPYKEERYGLPPAIVTSVKVKEMPVAWRTSALNTGVVITEKERPYLVTAPPELIKVLPARDEVRYYVAGGNVVAVDKEYRVVDSVQIPSIKITVDD
ncbi:hypothetical protein [Luteolibacter luteus]|uniref:DUF1236 domain-containing protein n=1 Tax=Luteolibacter luteus TaxID=2728835 RepID=A0A858RIF1_9BACT|nr:hypothetical protein [Luteolibacter luteus]QJE96000.1 hypothetical protein HHL09_09460 [Luteolibacter luteus]